MYEKTEIERSKLRGIQPGRPGLINDAYPLLRPTLDAHRRIAQFLITAAEELSFVSGPECEEEGVLSSKWG